MIYFIAALTIILSICSFVAVLDWMWDRPRSLICDTDADSTDDDPYLIEAGRHIRETRSELRARLDAEHEAMVA